MKQILILFIAIIAVANLSASTVQVDGIWYYLSSSTKVAFVVNPGDYEYSGSIVIPGKVTYKNLTYPVTAIAGGAFYDCQRLTSISIPNSVTSIGGSCFYNCKGLTSVTIPNSVKAIEAYAFSDCDGLTSVTIPNSVTKIGNKVFLWCDSLASIIVEFGNIVYDSRENCNAIIETATNTLIQGCKNTTIPNSITTIGDDAFEDCRELTSITIPNSVTTIGLWAFFGCTGLTSITIPNSVTTIGKGAFAGCEGLTTLTISNSVTTIEEKAFWFCEGLISVTIPNSVTSIGERAFASCHSLTSLTIPNSVTTIKDYAFAWCRGLSSVSIPNSVTTIGEFVFIECFQLASPLYNDAIFIYMPQLYEGTYTIPDGLKQIAVGAFYDCSGLTSVTIPNSVILIGEVAFFGCRSLTSINVDAANTHYCSTDGVLFDYKKDTLIQYPASSARTEYVIPNTVSTIAEDAFVYSNNLTSIEIPQSVSTIEVEAFACCNSLISLIVYWTDANELPIMGKDVFCEIANQVGPSAATLHVPAGTKSIYETADQWKDFGFIIEEGTGLEHIKPNSPASLLRCTKTIENGQLLIKAKGETYTPSGQKVR